MTEQEMEILTHFEKHINITERIAWNHTLERLDREDLLLLWNLAPFDHPLFKEDSLATFFRERIDSLGGFKLVK